MGLAERYIPHYTYKEWKRWKGLWELIKGCPIALIPLPPPLHQRVSGELQGEFKLAIKKGQLKECIIYPTIGYQIADDTILAPDILIVCKKITKDLLDFPPALIVEVLTSSTEKRDRELKYKYYEQEGVKYYLIADWKKKSLEIYELINGKYQLQQYTSGFEFTFKDDCSISPDLNNIWNNL